MGQGDGEESDKGEVEGQSKERVKPYIIIKLATKSSSRCSLCYCVGFCLKL